MCLLKNIVLGITCSSTQAFLVTPIVNNKLKRIRPVLNGYGHDANMGRLVFNKF